MSVNKLPRKGFLVAMSAAVLGAVGLSGAGATRTERLANQHNGKHKEGLQFHVRADARAVRNARCD